MILFDKFIADAPWKTPNDVRAFREAALECVVFHIDENIWDHTTHDEIRAVDAGAGQNLASPLPYPKITLGFENAIFTFSSLNHENGWPALMCSYLWMAWLKDSRYEGPRDAPDRYQLPMWHGKYKNWSHTATFAQRYSPDGEFLGDVDREANEKLFDEADRALEAGASFDFDRIKIQRVPDGPDELAHLDFLTKTPHAILNKFLNFLSCVNVRTVDVVPSAREQREHKQPGRLPLVSFKTLELKQRKSFGASEKLGLWTNRVHLCRGHFAEYTDEAPLFGKYVGRFWIPPHARGDRVRGIVNKDYAIESQSAAPNR